MWTAAGVALVAIVAAVMSFVSRGKALKTVGEMGEEIAGLESDIEILLEQIEALAAGDHGLDHADMRPVVFPLWSEDYDDS